MFGTTGHRHVPPKTKREIQENMRIEAIEHARYCEALAQAMYLLGDRKIVADALAQSARFLTYFTDQK